MQYYCRVDSAGGLENTNLQLYSLGKAADGWNELLDLIEETGAKRVDHLTERLAFILSCFGLSLAQLIGQNYPSPDKKRMGQPDDLLSSLLKRTKADRTTQKFLNRTFRDFLAYYAAIRHFGQNKDEGNYRTIERLTLGELNRFRRMTIKIWDLVIAMYRQDEENDLEEVSSVTEIVEFKELAKQ